MQVLTVSLFLIFFTCSSFARDSDDDDKVRDILGSTFRLDPFPGKKSSRRVPPIDRDDENDEPASMQKGVENIQKGITGLFGSVMDTDSLPFPISMLFKSLGEMKDKLQQKKKEDKKEDDYTSPFSFMDRFGSSRKSKTSKNLEGPHICVKEISLSENIDVKLECEQYRDASVCTSQSGCGKMTKRIQYCCDGYTTDDIREKGCDTEISDELIYFRYNISRSDVPNNSTLLSSELEDKSYILPGIQNVFEWNDKQIIETSEKEKFVVRQNTDRDMTDIYLNCALKKETIRMENSQILKFDGALKPAADNLLAIISQNPELSTFNKILGEDLQKMLRETKSATVFAFTNEAFEKLPEQTRKQILSSADKNDCIQEIMKQHITTDGSYCSNLPKSVKSVYGTNLSIRNNGSVLNIDDAQIIDSSGFALNGVVHIIDRVLVRDNFLSWQDTLRVFNAELADQLEDTNITLPVTIFVPPTAKNETNIENPQNYLVSNRLISKFDSIQNIVTDANSTIFTRTSSEDDDSLSLFSIRVSRKDISSSENVKVGCSKLSAPSIYSCKAIIHFLDKPLPIVTKTVEEYIESREDLNMFAKIWKKSNISFDSTSRITVFAPTNDAFSANFLKKIMKNQGTAESFVNRHIVKEILCESDVKKSKYDFRSPTYTSVGGLTLTPIYEAGQFTINDANIQEVELVQSNGVVHILETFIEPTSKSFSSKFGKNEMPGNPLSILGGAGGGANPFSMLPMLMG